MVTSTKRSHRERAQTIVEVTASLTILDTIVVTDYDALAVHIDNADVTFDQFEIAGNVVRDGTFEILFNAAVDFTSPAGIMIGASGDLTALANGAQGWFLLYPKGFYSIRVRAASSGADTTTTTNSGGS